MKGKISILIGVLIILGVCLFTTGCGYKSINTEEFKNHFSALGFTISETEEAPYESKTYVVAKKDDLPFNIEYYEFEDETSAKKVFKKYFDNIASYITSTSENSRTQGSQIDKDVSVSDNEYIIISRVKKTLIFIVGPKEYSEQIDKFVEDINY